MLKVRKGFTVIEIAIVVAIVAILAGVWYMSKNKAGADIFPPGYKVANLYGNVYEGITQPDGTIGKGNPINGAEVRGVTTDPISQATVFSTGGGYYKISLAVKPTGDTMATITAGATGYEPATITTKYGPTSTEEYQQSILLKKIKAMPAIITGHVRNNKGQAIVGARVTSYPNKCFGIQQQPPGVLTDTDGKFTFTVAPGKYCLIAGKETAGQNDQTSIEKNIVAIAGKEIQVDFIVPTNIGTQPTPTPNP